jgi:MFS family permease
MSSILRDRGFLWLWGAQSVSAVGSEITFVALPLVAIGVLGASPLEAGALSALGYVPFLLLSLVVGAWADRLPPKPVLVLADLGRTALLAVIPFAWWQGWLGMPLLYAVALLCGCLTVLFDICHQSMLPALVGREHLVEGNSRLQMSASAAMLVGPGLAGLLVGAVGAPSAMGADAASFLVSALLLSQIRAVHPPPAPQGAPMGAQIAEGLRFVLGHPVLRPLVGAVALANLFQLYGVVQVLLPFYLLEELRLTGMQYGLVLALANAGAMLGAWCASQLSAGWGLGRAMGVSFLLPPVAIGLLSLASPGHPLWVVLPALALAGFGAALFNVLQISLRQHLTPPALQGRTSATIRFLIWGTIPLGTLLGGALGQGMGPRPALVVASAGGFAAALLLAFSPLTRLERLP